MDKIKNQRESVYWIILSILMGGLLGILIFNGLINLK